MHTTEQTLQVFAQWYTPKELPQYRLHFNATQCNVQMRNMVKGSRKKEWRFSTSLLLSFGKWRNMYPIVIKENHNDIIIMGTEPSDGIEKCCDWECFWCISFIHSSHDRWLVNPFILYYTPLYLIFKTMRICIPHFHHSFGMYKRVRHSLLLSTSIYRKRYERFQIRTRNRLLIVSRLTSRVTTEEATAFQPSPR